MTGAGDTALADERGAAENGVPAPEAADVATEAVPVPPPDTGGDGCHDGRSPSPVSRRNETVSCTTRRPAAVAAAR